MKKTSRQALLWCLVLALIGCLGFLGCSSDTDDPGPQQEPQEVSVPNHASNLISIAIGDAIGVRQPDDLIHTDYSRWISNWTVLVPPGTHTSSLIPTIVISNGATISPASGVETDFSNPVIYTVISEDQTSETLYRVKVEEQLATLSFGLVQGGNDNIEIYGIDSDYVTKDDDGVIVLNTWQSITISVGANTSGSTAGVYPSGTQFSYTIDGGYYPTATITPGDNIISIYAGDFSLRKVHTVSIMVTINNVKQSAYFQFKVVE